MLIVKNSLQMSSTNFLYLLQVKHSHMALMKHLEEDVQKQDERVRRMSDTIVQLFNKNHKQDRYAKLLSMAHAKDHYFLTALALNIIFLFLLSF